MREARRAIVVPDSGSCLPPANPEGLRYRGECSDGKEVWIDAIFTSPGKHRGLFLQSESDSKAPRWAGAQALWEEGSLRVTWRGQCCLFPSESNSSPHCPCSAAAKEEEDSAGPREPGRGDARGEGRLVAALPSPATATM